MEKINYQLKTDAFIEKFCLGEEKPSLLLHSCCAPCSSYVLEYLNKYFDITLFFSNSNITASEEYKKRLLELYRLCREADFCKNVKIIEDEYSPQDFFDKVSGLENEPEGGKRCTACFELRLKRTADYALKNGFKLFATTLTVSPHKNAQLINEIGYRNEERTGVGYLPSDFKKRGGYQRSIVLSREYGIYRQQYCGCIFSKQ